MKQQNLHEDAFTGIEAAIVLIAFITVGSVFTYVMLGTGFFATQVSQKTANAGVQGASSNVILVGDILGLASYPFSNIDTVQFRVGLPSGATPVQFTSSQIIIINNEGSLESLVYTSDVADEGKWNSSSTGVLSANEILTINATPSTAILPGTQFTLEVKPPGGASLNIRRTVPRGLDPVNILY